jgi:hypothetical protein
MYIIDTLQVRNENFRPEIITLRRKVVLTGWPKLSDSQGEEFGDVFWDDAPCSVVDIKGRFRGVYCLHHQADVLYDSHACQVFTSRRQTHVRVDDDDHHHFDRVRLRL